VILYCASHVVLLFIYTYLVRYMMGAILLAFYAVCIRICDTNYN
jgi:hypothetical protein